MPVPSLPPRSPRDGEGLPGRHRPVNARGGPAAPATTGDADAAFAAAFPDGPLSPAMLAEDGRSAVMILNEARDRAGRVAEGLKQLETAGAELARVQQLVARLRDVAVVALDRSIHPAERAALQRQVDLVLTDIDTVADETLVDGGLLHAEVASVGAGGTRPTPFGAIGTSMLGLAGLAVRSSDQALAATGALDVATTRLERSAGTLSRATARLQDVLLGLTSPMTTAICQTALGSMTAALSSTIMRRAHLASNPQEAAQAQAELDIARVKRLLDSSSR